MFRCNDNEGRYLDVFLKNVPIEPDTEYLLSADQFGGAFGIWINKSFAVSGLGPYYFDHCDSWATREIRFTTGKNTAKLASFENWGISLFKKINSLYINGHQDTYIDNIRLCKVAEPENNLLVGGDFEAPPGDPLYAKNWEGMILGGVGSQMGVSLTTDPLNTDNHCLLLPKILVTPDYPEHITLRVDGFGWYKNELNHTFLRDPIGLPMHLLLLVEQGDTLLFSENSSKKVAAGNAIYIPPHTPIHYRGQRGKNTSLYWVMFHGETADQLLKSITETATTPAPLPRFSALTTHIDQMLHSPSNNVMYPYALSAHLQLLLVELSEQLIPKEEEPHKQMIDRIAERFREFPEQPVDNTKLAQECGFSAGHFIRLFKQYQGCTPHQYHLRALMQKARTLLRDTTLSVQEIAFSLGIDNPLYFSRLFRSTQGISPSEYRKRKK